MAKWSDIDPAELHPESLMMTYGFRPEWSEGPPHPDLPDLDLRLASAAEGARCFEIAYGMSERRPEEHPSLIYCADQQSQPRDRRRTPCPVGRCRGRGALRLGHGGDHDDPMGAPPTGRCRRRLVTRLRRYPSLHRDRAPQYGIAVVRFDHDATAEDIANLIAASGHRLGMVYVETPANPTNDLIDLQMCAAVAARFRPPITRCRSPSTTPSSGRCSSVPLTMAPTSSSIRRLSTSADMAISSLEPCSDPATCSPRSGGCGPLPAT